MVSDEDTSLSLTKAQVHKKVLVAEKEKSNLVNTDRKGASRFNGLFNDIANELYSQQGAYMWLVKALRWKMHPKHLVNFRENLFRWRESGKVSDNIRRVSVLAVPTFPSKDPDIWQGVGYLKIVFVHIRKLTEITNEILSIARKASVRIFGHRQTEVRDTCIVLVADEMDKGANVVFQHKARIRSANGSRIAYVFGTNRGPYIRKLLYTFLGNYLTQRAERAEESGTESLRKLGSDRGIYGDLKDCCEFVAGLGKKLHELADKIKLSWGARKTKAEYHRDKLVSMLDQRPLEEKEAEARETMRVLRLAELEARRDKGRSPLVTKPIGAVEVR